MTDKIEWRNIYNTNHTFMLGMAKAFEIARLSGYPYLVWNGRVIEIGTTANPKEIDTGYMSKSDGTLVYTSNLPIVT